MSRRTRTIGGENGSEVESHQQAIDLAEEQKKKELEQKNIEIMTEKTEKPSEAPKLRKLGMSVWIWLVDHPAALIMIVAILIVLLYTRPVQTLIFFITIGLSMVMGFVLHSITSSRMFAALELTEVEKILVSGAASGLTGFIVGTWSEYNLTRLFL